MPDGVVTGAWTRDGVETEYGNDYNRGIYPQRCTFLSKDLERKLKSAYRARGNDPRVVMAFLNGDYTSDGATDTWISSFKTGNGDCDRSFSLMTALCGVCSLQLQQNHCSLEPGVHILLAAN
jgi:hypothetical protein